MTKRNLPPAVHEHIERMVEDFRAGLIRFYRFHGMDTIDAVCVLLRECGHALSQDKIVDELKAGGIPQSVSESKGGADADLKRAIGFSLARHDRLRQVGELIGLAEWEDERFQ